MRNRRNRRRLARVKLGHRRKGRRIRKYGTTRGGIRL